MAEPYIGEIRMMSFYFAPKGWATCDGQIMAIAQNQALFSLLGTKYGGDGRVTFGLPDLRGRVPLHVSSTHALSSRGGEQAHVLTVAEMPAHSHQLACTSAAADQRTATNLVPAVTGFEAYGPAPATALDDRTCQQTGLSSGHDNMQPYLVVDFVIALQGIYPARS